MDERVGKRDQSIFLPFFCITETFVALSWTHRENKGHISGYLYHSLQDKLRGSMNLLHEKRAAGSKQAAI